MNYDPIEVVIDKTIRTFRLKEWAYDIEDMAEDIAEALKLIGANKVYGTRTVVKALNAKVVKLPLDCEFIKEVQPKSKYYKEEGTYLILDLPDGTPITITYQALPLDARGFPLVPDNAAVREAIMWYLTKILTLQGVITKIPFQMAEQEWQWRCGSARADLNVPDLQAVERMYQDFVRLNPLKDQWMKNFVGLGKQNTLDREKLKHNYYYRDPDMLAV